MWRTSAVSGEIGLPTEVTSGELVARSAQLGPGPLFAVTYGEDYVFVSGGTPFLLDMLSEAQGGNPVDKSAATYAQAAKNVAGGLTMSPFIAVLT